MGEATNTSHLEEVERGYENMDYYTVNFKKERRALSAINFILGKNMFFSFSLFMLSSDKLIRLKDYNVSVADLKPVWMLLFSTTFLQMGMRKRKMEM